MQYSLRFTAQECDANTCSDRECPYIHRDMWQYRRKDNTNSVALSRGFDTWEEANAAAALDETALREERV